MKTKIKQCAAGRRFWRFKIGFSLCFLILLSSVQGVQVVKTYTPTEDGAKCQIEYVVNTLTERDLPEIEFLSRLHENRDAIKRIVKNNIEAKGGRVADFKLYTLRDGMNMKYVQEYEWIGFKPEYVKSLTPEEIVIILSEEKPDYYGDEDMKRGEVYGFRGPRTPSKETLKAGINWQNILIIGLFALVILFFVFWYFKKRKTTTKTKKKKIKKSKKKES